MHLATDRRNYWCCQTSRKPSYKKKGIVTCEEEEDEDDCAEAIRRRPPSSEPLRHDHVRPDEQGERKPRPEWVAFHLSCGVPSPVRGEKNCGCTTICLCLEARVGPDLALFKQPATGWERVTIPEQATTAKPCPGVRVGMAYLKLEVLKMCLERKKLGLLLVHGTYVYSCCLN
jgi:hypothetical protein